MLSKNQIKFVRSLAQKKFRKQHRLFLTEGTKIVPEFLASSYQLHSLYALPPWLEQNKPALPADAEVVTVALKDLERISELKTPNEVAGVFHMPQPTFNWSLQQGLLPVLDGIQDPGNLGTIVRTADWFGLKQVICSENCVDVFNPKTVQSTMGSLSRVAVHYVDLPSWLEQVPAGTEIYGAVMDGTSLYQQTFSKNGLLVLGNESNGISEAVMAKVQHPTTIPAFGGAESLNVAMAHAIISSEYKRQHA